MNKKDTALIYDALTGEVTIRELTPAELEDKAELEITAQAELAEQEAKLSNRESALAKLAALGLTEAEIAAL
jgi:DNA-binding NarL/FixJ family response regulator